VEPVNAGDVKGRANPTHRGIRYSHFQGGQAVVDHVLGEFYWAVSAGDTTKTSDYVAPPRMLSFEEDTHNNEITWSLGTYKQPSEIETAFGLAGKLPRRRGVGPHQPSPWEGRVGPLWVQALLGAGLMFFLYMALLLGSLRTVHKQHVTVPPGVAPGAPEAAVFTQPFVIDRPGNVQVRVDAPVANSWLYVDGALINEETGGLDEFDLEASYYHGQDSDGSWSEGSQSAAAYVATVPPGRYVLRLAPQWQAGLPVRGYEVTVRSRVPRFTYLFLAMLSVFAWPVLASWSAFRFHVARWSESDHPVFESGE